MGLFTLTTHKEESSNSTLAPSKKMSGKVYSLEEVAKHKTANNYWIVLEDRIYDVSDFLFDHPGGPEILKNHAGLDATEDWLRQGHSSEAKKRMAKYFIGALEARKPVYNADGDRVFSLAEVARHKSPGRYWLILDNRVYDVSNFLGEHPGGPEPLKVNAGGDATDEFRQMGHTEEAKKKLASLQIGVLDKADWITAATKKTDASYCVPKPVKIREESGLGVPTMMFFVLLVTIFVSYLLAE